LAQAAATFFALGRTDAAQRLLARLRRSGSTHERWDEWRLRQSLPRVKQPPLLDSWPLPGGTPERNGRAAVEDVLPAPRWCSRLTEVPELEGELHQSVLRQAVLGATRLPTLVPVTVNDVVVFRDFRGLRACRVSTGEPLWFRPATASPEEVAVARPASGLSSFSTSAWSGPAAVPVAASTGAFRSAFAPQSERERVLRQALFDDALYGLLSSDGRRVYCLEAQTRRVGGGELAQTVVPALAGPVPVGGALFARSHSSRERAKRAVHSLRAYDLQTGELVWQVGGPDVGLDDPLAGVFFLGPPLPLRGRLFVVGLSQHEMRLYCLESETGRLAWSQQLGTLEQSAVTDALKRWPLPVAVGGGALVCSNGFGWLLAFDPVGRTFLWARRYFPRQSRSGGSWGTTHQVVYSMNRTRGGSLWRFNPPVVVGQRVLFAPAEKELLLCVDLSTGQTLWSQRRERALYVVGALADAAFVVYSQYVQAVSLKDGHLLWRKGFPPGTRPAGRGVLSKERVLVPLSDNSLWSVRTDGTDVRRLQLVDAGHWLGNLVSSGPRLVSLGPLGLACFDEKSTGEAWLQEQLSRTPAPLQAVLLKAQMLLAEGKPKPAWELLRRLSPTDLTAPQKWQVQLVLERCLRALVSAKRPDPAAEQALRRLLEQQGRQAEWLQLTAERLVTTGRFVEAVQTLWQLAELVERAAAQGAAPDRPQSLVTPPNTPNQRVRGDVWAARRLRSLWPQLSPSARRSVEQWLEEKRKQAAQDEPTLRRLVRLFGFHPSVVELSFGLSEQLAREGEWLKAESLLRQLAESNEADVAARALTELAELLRDNGLPDDAALVLRQLAHRFPEHRLPDGQTAAQAWRRLVESGLPVGWRRLPAWPGSTWKVRREPGQRVGVSRPQYGTDAFSRWLNSPLAAPSLCRFQLWYDLSQRRLKVIRAEDGRPWWSVPLQALPVLGGSFTPLVVASGHRLLVWHRGVLHCLDLYKRRVVWTYCFPEAALGGTSSVGSPLASTFSLWAGGTTNFRLLRYAPRTGPFAFVSRTAVGLGSLGRLYVVDLTDGRLLWTLDGVTSSMPVLASDQAVFTLSPADRRASAYRLCDGQSVPTRVTYTVLVESLYLSGWRATVAGAAMQSGPKGPSTRNFVCQLDVRSGEVLWEVTRPPRTYVARLDPRTLVLTRPSGQLELLDLETGRSKVVEAPAAPSGFSGSVATALLSGSLVYDGAQFYVVVTARGGNIAGALPSSIRAHGTVTAYDRWTGRQLWHKEVQNQTLTLLGLKQSRFLLLGSYRPKQKGQVGYRELQVHLWDKETGRELLQAALPTYTQYAQLALDCQRRELVLQSYNERVRLVRE